MAPGSVLVGICALAFAIGFGGLIAGSAHFSPAAAWICLGSSVIFGGAGAFVFLKGYNHITPYTVERVVPRLSENTQANSNYDLNLIQGASVQRNYSSYACKSALHALGLRPLDSRIESVANGEQIVIYGDVDVDEHQVMKTSSGWKFEFAPEELEEGEESLLDPELVKFCNLFSPMNYLVVDFDNHVVDIRYLIDCIRRGQTPRVIVGQEAVTFPYEAEELMEHWQHLEEAFFENPVLSFKNQVAIAKAAYWHHQMGLPIPFVIELVRLAKALKSPIEFLQDVGGEEAIAIASQENDVNARFWIWMRFKNNVLDRVDSEVRRRFFSIVPNNHFSKLPSLQEESELEIYLSRRKTRSFTAEMKGAKPPFLKKKWEAFCFFKDSSGSRYTPES